MKKNLIIIVLAIALVFIGLFAFNQYRENQSDKARIAALVATEGKNEVVTKYVRDSIEHIVYRDKTIKDTEAERRLAITNSYADSLEQALKISINRIDQALKVNSRLDAKLKLQQSANAITYQDKFLKLRYVPDSSQIFLSYDMGINIARYSKRRWLFGTREHYIDVFADDPRVTIKGLRSYTIQERPQKRFGIGLQAGYGFSIYQNQIQASPHIGIGLNYNLIQF